MKNVCIVLKSGKSAFLEEGYFALLEEFYAKGYAFDEVRFLFQEDETALRFVLSDYKQTYENVLLIASKSQFALCKNALPKDLKEESFQNDAPVCVFSWERGSLFLLATDGAVNPTQCVREYCLPYLEKKRQIRQGAFVVRAVGANSLRVEQLIAKAEALAKGQIRILRTKTYAEDVIRVLYGENASKMLLDDVLRLFAEGMGDTVYALEDVMLSEQLIRLLKLRGKRISVAESFTGGGIAKKLTSVSGASEVYFEGINAYHENAKIKRLGVSEYTLKTLGAVSDQTAYEMAAGLIATGDCELSIATTGLAGPNTDRSGLPVGLCYIAIGSKESVYVYRYQFEGTREEITNYAIQYAMFLAYKQLKNM